MTGICCEKTEAKHIIELRNSARSTVVFQHDFFEGLIFSQKHWSCLADLVILANFPPGHARIAYMKETSKSCKKKFSVRIKSDLLPPSRKTKPTGKQQQQN
jgi:hypothetical protein